MKFAKMALVICTLLMIAVTAGVIMHFVAIKNMDIPGLAILASSTLGYSYAYSLYLTKRSEQFI